MYLCHLINPGIGGSVADRLQKFKRIRNLDSWGLNIPNMLVCHREAGSPNTFSEVTFYLKTRKIANIRTYRLHGEGFNNPHLFQQPTWKLIDQGYKLVRQGYVIMVEDFNPAHTIYNGTLVLHPRSDHWQMDYCIGRGKTVRMVDRYITGYFEDLYGTRFPYPIRQIVHEGACFCPLRPVTLEWSWSVVPQGKREQCQIFWEYRSIRKAYGW